MTLEKRIRVGQIWEERSQHVLAKVVIKELFHLCYVHIEGKFSVPNIEKSIFLHECIYVVVVDHQ